MEQKSGSLTLRGIFWRYLFTVGGSILLLSGVWWFLLILLMRTGAVLPANAAERSLAKAQQAVRESGLSPEEALPYWFHWALLDAEGRLLDTDMSEGLQKEALSAGREGGIVRSFPYDRYYSAVALENGNICVLEYDYSAVYGNAALQEWLPDFQTCALLVLLAGLVFTSVAWTKHYADILKRDAGKLTEAAAVIGARRLDAEFSDKAAVRELGSALQAMRELQKNLADSFSRQWMLEQKQREELAALLHDLKTPLTIIQGNADLLEESLTGEQQCQAEAILENAEHIRSYTVRLREVAAGNVESILPMRPVSLRELIERAAKAGRALAYAEGVELAAPQPPDLMITANQELLFRALLNLLDNAVRYTPKGGGVELSAKEEDEIVTVTVRDTGPGFSEEALRRGGSIFYTTEDSRPREGHMGMGLTFAAETARCHGGKLRLYNTPEGAAAELTLKLGLHTGISDEP